MFPIEYPHIANLNGELFRNGVLADHATQFEESLTETFAEVGTS